MRFAVGQFILPLALTLTACLPVNPPAPTPDINSIKTSVANTVVAEFTQTASVNTAVPSLTPGTPATSVSATATLAGTATPLGTLIGCIDDANYGDPLDVNIPDNTEMTAGQKFIKTWTIKNTGTCPWRTGYTVVYGFGDGKLNGLPQPITGEVQTGQEAEISVEFQAPTQPGTYTSFWRLSSPNGGPFGKFFSVKIIIK